MPIILPAPALAPIAPRLASMLESDTLPHALLVEGAAQAVRREAALALARLLLCSSNNSNNSDNSNNSSATGRIFI